MTKPFTVRGHCPVLGDVERHPSDVTLWAGPHGFHVTWWCPNCDDAHVDDATPRGLHLDLIAAGVEGVTLARTRELLDHRRTLNLPGWDAASARADFIRLAHWSGFVADTGFAPASREEIRRIRRRAGT